MIPLKGDDLHSSKPRNLARNSQMSFQSVAYSFYDLEGDNPSTPTSPAPAALEIAFPHGKYMKVSVSNLEREKENRERSMSDPTFRREAFSPGLGNKGRTEEELVYAGIEARGKGELPKAAWYFMKAAEGGSATGRMYWGKSPPVSLTSLK